MSEIDRLYRLVFTSLIGRMLTIVVTVLVRVLTLSFMCIANTISQEL